MDETAKIGQALLPLAKFRFTLKVTSLMLLPPYKGAVFRGAFGSFLKRIVCALPRSDCTNCLLSEKCLYLSVFEPKPPPDFTDAAKYSPAPPPFVLNPPLTNRQAFHPGENLEFELVLMGRIIEALPHFVYTFAEIGRRGLGKERGKFKLERVDLVGDGTENQVYDGDRQTLSAFNIETETVDGAKDYRANHLTIQLLTPLRLKLNGRLVTQLNFPLFFERLSQRLTLLISFYGSNGNLPDLAFLTDQARQIQVSSYKVRWYDWKRYSGRQKAEMNLGGLKGEITFSGELAHFMPLIKIGEQVNVGLGTSFGLGRYSIN